MENNPSDTHVTIQCLEWEQTPANVDHGSVTEDHLPRGFADAALLGQTLTHLLGD